MGTRELLNYLEKLEIGLSSFSYEELGVVEAGELKKSFEIFKHGLEDKVFGVSELKQLEDLYKRMGILEPQRKSASFDKPITKDPIFQLLDALENTPLNKTQLELTKALKKAAEKLVKIDKNTPESMPNHFQYIEKSLVTGYSEHKINLKPVLEDCMGRMELLEELVRMFKHNVLEFIGSSKIHLLNEDFSALALCCQKVGPNLRMMKTYELLEIVQQISLLSKTDNDSKHLAFLYEQFVTEYPMIQEQVDFEMELFRTM
ncbi:hypothetical protein [Allomuricauda sp. M10]|uniref:hypothetical protein n=1 Tax=Allomuricauda sp. M10 TaxID=2683292 RepID=UPI001D182EE5|nr:hypothetical protein [Muricauda sp. M10]